MDGKKELTMPDKHFYFSIGATIGTGLTYYIHQHSQILEQNNWFFRKLRKKSRHWFLYFPVLIFIVGLWGIIPDILHALNVLPKETTRSDLFNIFFFHSYFEHIEDKYLVINRILNWIGEGALAVISMGIMFFYIKLIAHTLNSQMK